MRVNDEALYHVLSAGPCSMEGTLTHQTPKGKMKQRHFRLIRNLLFHYSERKEDGVGLLVIERCRLDLVGVTGQQSRKFSLMFEGEAGQKHVFTAQTPELCRSWIKVLQAASHQHLKMLLMSLKQKLEVMTGSDPVEVIRKHELAKILGQPLPTSHSKGGATMKLRHKTLVKKSGPSTFYTKKDVVEAKKEMEPKSKFFASLDVVRAPVDKERSGTLDSTRSLSSGVAALRQQARTLGRTPATHSADYSRTYPDLL